MSDRNIRHRGAAQPFGRAAGRYRYGQDAEAGAAQLARRMKLYFPVQSHEIHSDGPGTMLGIARRLERDQMARYATDALISLLLAATLLFIGLRIAGSG